MCRIIEYIANNLLNGILITVIGGLVLIFLTKLYKSIYLFKIYFLFKKKISNFFKNKYFDIRSILIICKINHYFKNIENFNEFYGSNIKINYKKQKNGQRGYYMEISKCNNKIKIYLSEEQLLKLKKYRLRYFKKSPPFELTNMILYGVSFYGTDVKEFVQENRISEYLTLKYIDKVKVPLLT